MTEEDWAKLQDAFLFMLKGGSERIDGGKWIVYKVGTIFRIDIKVKT